MGRPGPEPRLRVVRAAPAAMAATGLPAGLAVRAVMPELHGCWWCLAAVALMVPGAMAEREAPRALRAMAATAPMGMHRRRLAETAVTAVMRVLPVGAAPVARSGSMGLGA